MRGFMRWIRSPVTIDAGYKPCFSKAAYPSEKVAGDILAKRQAKSSVPLRIYRCDICTAWHLTKREAK